MVFSADRKHFNIREFIEFNKSVSSEMFISVISVLQERLPCSQYIFAQKKGFKQTEINRNLKLLQAGTHPSGQGCQPDHIASKAEELCLSPLKALPNPRMLQNFQPKKVSTFKPSSLQSPVSTHSLKKSPL